MVKKIVNFFLYLLFFMIVLLYFTPKISLYYLAEQKIKPISGVIISKESLKDNGFSLEIDNAHISLKGIDSAVIEKINIKILGFFNTLNINNITLSSVADSFIPLHIESIYMHYSLLNPLNIIGKIEGDFGEASVIISLNKDRLQPHLLVTLTASSKMKKGYRRTLRNFKKNKEGEFIYEKNI